MYYHHAQKPVTGPVKEQKNVLTHMVHSFAEKQSLLFRFLTEPDVPLSASVPKIIAIEKAFYVFKLNKMNSFTVEQQHLKHIYGNHC